MELHRDQSLAEIRENLLRMGATVEQMIVEVTDALVNRDMALAESIIERDRQVDGMEKELDEACLEMMARHQPTASDLRFLVSTMKITNDLERIGDSTVNIAESVKELSQEAPLKPYIDLPRMANGAGTMVKDSLDAFVKRDAPLALDVCERDDRIDDLYHQLFRELLTYMMGDPQCVTRALHLLMVARNLERIADHATNIAEDAIYFVEARDIRHPRRSEQEE